MKLILPTVVSVFSVSLFLPMVFGQTISGEPAAGKVVYEKHCMACHGLHGKGDGPTGKAIQPPAADFTSARSKKKSPTDLRTVIEEGRANTAMAAWMRRLSDEEIQHVLAYVLSLRNEQAPSGQSRRE